MIKTLFCDCDGFVIKKHGYFSHQYSEEYDVPIELFQPFFKGRFLDCEKGKADLKEELAPHLSEWKWNGSVEGFVDYWFQYGKQKDLQVINFLEEQRSRNVKCFFSTNNEKYRVDFLLNNVGLKNCFDEFFASSSVGYLKYEPEFWPAVYKPDMGQKHEALVIDDDQRNLDTAKNFGFQTHFYNGLDGLKSALENFNRA